MYKHLTCAVATAALLAACGGGGGGSPVAAGTPAAVQITQENARPVGAHASDSVQNTGATQGSTGLITGVQVQVQGGGGSGASTLLLAEVARALALRGAGAALASGVQVTQACEGGIGSITVDGSVASSNRLAAGDSVWISASQCRVDGQTIQGSMSVVVTSGQVTQPVAYPFRLGLAIAASNLSIASAGVTSSSDGDLALDWSATSASVQTLVASGTALVNGSDSGGSLRRTTWRNYIQSISMNGTDFTGSLSAAVESNSTRLGANGGSYTVSTPSALHWSTTTGLPVAGVILVTGAGDSHLRLTFTPTGATLEVDADGNGSYESQVDSTAADLRALL